MRPQFRPNLRRPSFRQPTEVNKRSTTVAPSQQNAIQGTTEFYNGVSSYIRRTRPTTTVRTPQQKLIAQQDTINVGSSSSQADNSSNASSTFSKTKPKIVIRRKFGPRPTVAAVSATSNGGGGERSRTRVTTTNSPDAAG